MPEEPDLWRQIHQCMPKDLYDRWMVQMKRIALANGISTESFDSDSKFGHAVGPRVLAYEALLIILEDSDDAVLRA